METRACERVEVVAREWTGRSMANLVLNFGAKDADIRIAFKAGNGSWSYIGTDCKRIPRSQPTMNYRWISADSPDDDLRRVVLHEFGHALGLIHEHQSPDHPINWNRDAVYKDAGGPPNNWDKATVDANIFQRYEPGQVTATPVDRDSIMLYAIPAAWTLDGFSVGFNTRLSDTDKKFIREAYPW
jgi:hypothetical protein